MHQALHDWSGYAASQGAPIAIGACRFKKLLNCVTWAQHQVTRQSQARMTTMAYLAVRNTELLYLDAAASDEAESSEDDDDDFGAVPAKRQPASKPAQKRPRIRTSVRSTCCFPEQAFCSLCISVKAPVGKHDEWHISNCQQACPRI